MLALLLYGLPIVCLVTLLLLIRHSVSRKQTELDGEQFRLWFPKACMGMEPGDQTINQGLQEGKKTVTVDSPAELKQRSAGTRH